MSSNGTQFVVNDEQLLYGSASDAAHELQFEASEAQLPLPPSPLLLPLVVPLVLPLLVPLELPLVLPLVLPLPLPVPLLLPLPLPASGEGLPLLSLLQATIVAQLPRAARAMAPSPRRFFRAFIIGPRKSHSGTWGWIRSTRSRWGTPCRS